MEWIEKHPVFVTILTALVFNGGAWIWHYVKQSFRLGNVEAVQASTGKVMEAMHSTIAEIKVDQMRHSSDTSKHLDPVRDAAASTELRRRLDRIEEKLNELLTRGIVRPRRRGESDNEEI